MKESTGNITLKSEDALRRLVMLFLFFLFSNYLYGQQVGQTIRGRVSDKYTFAPLAGASVVVINSQPPRGAITDSSGYFRIEDIYPGRHSIRVSFVGYNDFIIPHVLLNAGKEQMLTIELTPRATALEAVTITEDESTGSLNPLSSRSFSEEEAQRYAATFYDPARLLTSSAGVLATNDQSNHLSVRGNNPAGIGWRIEGADVVNPNHLTNAGTFTDKPSLTGGGVAIISMQLMGNSRFHMGVLPAGYGNALAGIFDINLRRGNDREYEFTAQAGLLGLDLAAEGPIIINHSGSFLVNYRYSTLGIFSALGIPIGDEEINFQDLSFNISIPSSKIGNFTLFGIGGRSTTLFSALRDSTQWEYQKDATDTDFFSDMGAAGITHTLKTGAGSLIRTSMAVSALNSQRTEEQIMSPSYSSVFSEEDKLTFIKSSLTSVYEQTILTKYQLQTGININHDRITLFNRNQHQSTISMHHDGSSTRVLFQPFINLTATLSSKMVMDAGLHLLYADFNQKVTAEPRLSLRYSSSPTSFFTLGYGLHSQLQHPAVYFNENPGNRNLGFTRSHSFTTGYSMMASSNLRLSTEVYYQYLFDIPVSADKKDSFSVINYFETTAIDKPLINSGSGRNYGIDVSAETPFVRGYYFIVAGSLYRSLYRGSDGIERSTRFDGSWLARLTAGREISIEKQTSIHVLGVNILATHAGGMRFTPIDDILSQQQEQTVYLEEQAFSRRLRDFFRVDVRLSWRKNKHGFTSTLSLDIQNLTGYPNPAWYYYDIRKQSTVIKNQLGMMPFLSYKIEF